MHTRQELQMRQALPLSMKIAMTKTRIREWVNYYGTDGVYVSFSGGKDSTVLLHLVREEYPDVEAVFVDVPTQYPELKTFATSFPNVTVIKPKMGFAQVVEKYGFPIFSKENADAIYGARKYVKSLDGLEHLRQGFDRQTDRQTDRQIPYAYRYRAIKGIGEYDRKNSTINGNADKGQQEDGEYP